MHDMFKYDDANGPADEEIIKELDVVKAVITVILDRQSRLSNGDEAVITISVSTEMEVIKPNICHLLNSLC